jgi:hypothetical protein
MTDFCSKVGSTPKIFCPCLLPASVSHCDAQVWARWIAKLVCQRIATNHSPNHLNPIHYKLLLQTFLQEQAVPGKSPAVAWLAKQTPTLLPRNLEQDTHCLHRRPLLSRAVLQKDSWGGADITILGSAMAVKTSQYNLLQ